MEQKDVEGYLSLQELGAVIDKIGYQNVLPSKKDRWPLTTEKDRIYQIHNPLKDEDDLDKKATDNGLDNKSTPNDCSPESTGPYNADQAEVAASKEGKRILWTSIKRKAAEKILLAFLVCIISTAILLPFFLLIGDSIRPWSSSVSYDYDETCDNVTVVSS